MPVQPVGFLELVVLVHGIQKPHREYIIYGRLGVGPV